MRGHDTNDTPGLQSLLGLWANGSGRHERILGARHVGNTFSVSGKDVFFNVLDCTRFGVLHGAAFRRDTPLLGLDVAVMGDLGTAWAVVQMRNWSPSRSVRLGLSDGARRGAAVRELSSL